MQGKKLKPQEANQSETAATASNHKEALRPALSNGQAEGQAGSDKAERDRGGKKLSREERACQRELAAQEKRRKEQQQAFWRSA